ncbi:MAG TPA: alpha/beta hydrolase [Deltaproteobacteria bacterium]|nr:alpha/beta hydrolase [Deltaproteobacteria bacterium]
MKRRYSLIFVTLLILGAGLFSCRTAIGPGDMDWNRETGPFVKTLDRDGHLLHYIDVGSGDPVVLVHGFAETVYSWHENVPALMEAGFRLILVDQPGHGRSGAPGGTYTYTLENQAEAVVKLTEHLGLRKFSIIGHSTGGSIALFIMINHPGRVQKAVVIDPICFKPPLVQLLKIPGMEFLANVFGGRWSIRTGLEDAYYDGYRVDDALVDEYSRPLERPEYYRTLISLEKQFYSQGFYKMTESYGQIQAPVLIIWGKEDTWLPEEQGAMLHGRMENSTLQVIENCGHMPHQECADRVNPLLVQFLQRL